MQLSKPLQSRGEPGSVGPSSKERERRKRDRERKKKGRKRGEKWEGCGAALFAYYAQESVNLLRIFSGEEQSVLDGGSQCLVRSVFPSAIDSNQEL